MTVVLVNKPATHTYSLFIDKLFFLFFAFLTHFKSFPLSVDFIFQTQANTLHHHQTSPL